MSRGYGRGSIVSFIVVGVLLVALVLGGLYVVKNQLGTWLGSQPVQEAGDEVQEIAREATDSDESPAPDETSTSEDKAEPVGDDVNTDSTDDSEPAPAADAPDDDTAADDGDTDTDGVPAAGVSGDDSDDTDDSIPTTGVELPQTGLGDSLLAMLPIAAMVAAAVAYRRSNLL